VGILTLSKADGRRFEQRHLRLASAFADYVGIAIENARLFEEARTLAITDDLTGLPTRRWFLPHARHQVEQARRYGEPISVLAVDLDRFKQVNDRYGHQTGDHVLREVASAIQQKLRAVDALCRFGGEEFLALLPRTAEEQAYIVADRLRKAVAASRIEDFNEAVTVSLGVAGASTLRPERYDLDLLIRRADQALYSAKDAGRDTVHASSGLGRRRR
jgi:diguanylate cyclase (GGDEF)-like protein